MQKEWKLHRETSSWNFFSPYKWRNYECEKEFELEDDSLTQSTFEYEVEIKTPENLLNVLKVSARTGVIEIDNED